MPRLLLVDDNPSIHKIAETLLAASDVQLVSCGSGDQALALVDQGDRFDVALLDTSMTGMDGWTLLRRLREAEATRRMPVAMMAGVLDVVDPEQVRLAPIQGFLKKPVELRDLADRVRRLMETPVPEPVAPEPDAGVLELGPEDLAPEDAEAGLVLDAPPAAGKPAATDSELVLEELDLEELRSLSLTGSVPALDAPALHTVPDALAVEPFTMPEFLFTDTLPEVPGAVPVTAEELPDLDLGQPLPAGSGPLESAAGLAEAPLDWSDDSDSLVGLVVPEPEHGLHAAPLAPFSDGITFSDLLEASDAPQAGAWAATATPATVPTPALGDRDATAPDPLAAILANPVLLDHLAKAVVARLGDQVLREIAWEVMPELAERLRRQEAP